MFRRQQVRELVSVIREQNALIERQTDRILHLAGTPWQPSPKDTADALERNTRPEPPERVPYMALPEQYPH